MTKLVMADTRSENAEMDIGRLNVRIDKVMVMIIIVVIIIIIMMVIIIIMVVIIMITMMMMFKIGRLNVKIEKYSSLSSS